MKLHPLPPGAKCAHCGNAGLAFVRQRGNFGDVYRCTAQTPCEGYTIHYRKEGKACGIAAEAEFNWARLNWIACPGQPEGGERWFRRLGRG
jgi:hypothetical protein